jgi:hypothetical protein
MNTSWPEVYHISHMRSLRRFAVALSLAVRSSPLPSASHAGCPVELHRWEVSGVSDPSATLTPPMVAYWPPLSLSQTGQAMVFPSGDQSPGLLPHDGSFSSSSS